MAYPSRRAAGHLASARTVRREKLTNAETGHHDENLSKSYRIAPPGGAVSDVP